MERLDKYTRIALDLDQTLIDHPVSLSLHHYVMDHPEKTFSIVTFRTNRDLVNLNRELQAYGLIDKSSFRQIISCPERIWLEFNEDQDMRKRSRLPNPVIDPHVTSLLPGEVKYFNWKAYVCRRIGAQVLVDDLEIIVAKGCHDLGIDFINTHSLNESEFV